MYYIKVYNEVSENIVVSRGWINVFCYNCSNFISSLLMISKHPILSPTWTEKWAIFQGHRNLVLNYNFTHYLKTELVLRVQSFCQWHRFFFSFAIIHNSIFYFYSINCIRSWLIIEPLYLFISPYSYIFLVYCLSAVSFGFCSILSCNK